MLRALLVILAGGMAIAPAIGATTARTPVQRDVEGYAVATCLTQQRHAGLVAQGNGWASIIVARGHGDIEDWAPLVAAVTAETKRRRVYAIKAEMVAEGSREMPIGYCAEIVDTPAVRRAIDATIRRMAPAYRRR